MRLPTALTLGVLLAALFQAVPSGADAQAGPPATVSQDQVTAFARAWVAVATVRDKAHAELADPRNKKVEDQARLREKLRADIASALKVHGFTQAEFDRLTLAVSTDDALRKLFESQVAELTRGKPGPGMPEASA